MLVTFQFLIAGGGRQRACLTVLRKKLLGSSKLHARATAGLAEGISLENLPVRVAHTHRTVYVHADPSEPACTMLAFAMAMAAFNTKDPPYSH